MSEEVKSHAKIDIALLKAQHEIKGAVKDSKNPHFRSQYASLDSCIQAVVPHLNANGVYLRWKVGCIENNNSISVIAIATHAESGEKRKTRAPVPIEKMNAHGIGSAITYGKRYSLAALAGLTFDADDDGNESVKEVKKTPPMSKVVNPPVKNTPPPPPAKNLNTVPASELDALFIKMGKVKCSPELLREHMKKEHNITQSGEITPEILKELNSFLDNAVGEAPAPSVYSNPLDEIYKIAQEYGCPKEAVDKRVESKYKGKIDGTTIKGLKSFLEQYKKALE